MMAARYCFQCACTHQSPLQLRLLPPLARTQLRSTSLPLPEPSPAHPVSQTSPSTVTWISETMTPSYTRMTRSYPAILPLTRITQSPRVFQPCRARPKCKGIYYHQPVALARLLPDLLLPTMNELPGPLTFLVIAMLVAIPPTPARDERVLASR